MALKPQYPIQIALKKQRFLCKKCGYSLLLESSIVKKHESISRTLKLSVLKDLQKNLSLAWMAEKHHISIPTVNKDIFLMKSLKNLCLKCFALTNLSLQKTVMELCLSYL